jgi:hypothetical protein
MAMTPKYRLDSIGSFHIKISTLPNVNPSRIFTGIFSFRIINLNNVARLKTIDLFKEVPTSASGDNRCAAQGRA